MSPYSLVVTCSLRLFSLIVMGTPEVKIKPRPEPQIRCN